MDNRHRRYVVEKRNQDGSLDFSLPQPPSHLAFGCSEDQLSRYYFQNCKEAKESAPMGEILAWFKAQKFQVRHKYW